ncbi:WxL protein peptidoglycan domain-containing protein [Planococcus sp. YIM B11945]|uniref:DUF916 domain-containing protein n=1 Tax=Planococcus sp. YIM B11945 TaxID=3435410 RepID=UPI003D7CF6BD
MYIRIFAFLIFSLMLPTLAFAEESSLQVEPIYPENQVPATKGYFDLNAKPGEQMTLMLKLENTKDTPINVRVEKSNAYTSPAGGIFYEAETTSEDTELLDGGIHLVDYMDVKETVTIPANETMELPIQLTVPEISGETVLGGIKVTEETVKEDSEEVGEDEANFVINTETTYAVAIQLNLPGESKADFSVGTAGFIPTTAQVFVEMANNADLIQGNVSGTYAVQDSEGAEMFSGTMDSFIMAPKTKIRYPIAWNNKQLEDGDYTLVVNGKAGGQEFAVNEAFSISNDEVQEFAETTNPVAETDEKEKGGIPTWVWIAVAVLFGLAMFLLGRRKKK